MKVSRQNLLSPEPHQEQPCRHMESLLHRELDDRPTGWYRWLKWFTVAHVHGCGPCRRFLQALRDNRKRLQAARQQDTDMEAIARLEKTLKASALKATSDSAH